MLYTIFSIARLAILSVLISISTISGLNSITGGLFEHIYQQKHILETTIAFSSFNDIFKVLNIAVLIAMVINGLLFSRNKMVNSSIVIDIWKNKKYYFLEIWNNKKDFCIILLVLWLVIYAINALLFMLGLGIEVDTTSTVMFLYTFLAKVTSIRVVLTILICSITKEVKIEHLSLSIFGLILMSTLGWFNYVYIIPYTHTLVLTSLAPLGLMYTKISLYINNNIKFIYSKLLTEYFYNIYTHLTDLFKSRLNGEEITNNISNSSEITNNLGKGLYDILKKLPMLGRYLDGLFSNLKTTNNVYVDSPFRNHVTPLLKKVIPIYPFNKISKFTSINFPKIVENPVEVSYEFKTHINNFKLLLLNNSELIKDYVSSSVFKYCNLNLSLKVGLEDQAINIKASFKNGYLESYNVENTRVKDNSSYSKSTDKHNFNYTSILAFNSNPLSYLWDYSVKPPTETRDLTVFMNNSNSSDYDIYSYEPLTNREIQSLIAELLRWQSDSHSGIYLKDVKVYLSSHNQIIMVDNHQHLLLTRLFRVNRDFFSIKSNGRVDIANTWVQHLIIKLRDLMSSNTNVHGESSTRKNFIYEEHNPNLHEKSTYEPLNFKSDFWASAYSSPVFDIWNNAHFTRFDDSGNFYYFILDVMGKFHYQTTDVGGHVHYPATNVSGQIHYPSLRESMHEPINFSNQGFEQSNIDQSINLSTNQGFKKDQEFRNRNSMVIENEEAINDRNIRMAMDNSVRDMDIRSNNLDAQEESSRSNYYNSYQESISNSHVESRNETTNLNRNQVFEDCYFNPHDVDYVYDPHLRFHLENPINFGTTSENIPQEESSIRNNKDSSPKEPDTGKNEEWSGKGKGKRKR